MLPFVVQCGQLLILWFTQLKDRKMEWIIERLKEASTWRGIVTLLGAIGISISPELVNQIGLVVVAIIGAIEVWRKEKA